MKLTDSQKVLLFDAFQRHSKNWLRVIPAHLLKKILRVYSTADLARRCNKSFVTINYHVRLGHVPGPSVRLGKRWYWSAEDAAAVEEYLSIRRYSPRSRYTKEEQDEMRRLHAAGMSQWEVAKKFGATQSLVSRIVNRKKYNRRRAG